jgi:hypothetical protein
MKNKVKALQMLALGMAFGAFNEFPDHGVIYRENKKSSPKKDTIPTWYLYRNAYSAMDGFWGISVPDGCEVIFSCKALNLKNAERKYRNYLTSKNETT